MNLKEKVKDIVHKKTDLYAWDRELDKIIGLAFKEVGKVIDDLDLELFLEDVIDKKTGKKVVIPKEVWELWNIYWEHIQEKLKQKIGIKGGKK